MTAHTALIHTYVIKHTWKHRPCLYRSWRSQKSAVAGEGENYRLIVLHSGRESGAGCFLGENGRMIMLYNLDFFFFCAPVRLSETEHNPSYRRHSSAKVNAQSTPNKLGRNPDMPRNVSTAPVTEFKISNHRSTENSKPKGKNIQISLRYVRHD